MSAGRIDREKRIVERMIRIYCRHREGNAELCGECAALVAYACSRLERCRFGAGKGSCRRCSVHCYRPDMRRRIRTVMRFSGPRMLLYAPLEFMRHLFMR